MNAEDSVSSETPKKGTRASEAAFSPAGSQEPDFIELRGVSGSHIKVAANKPAQIIGRMSESEEQANESTSRRESRGDKQTSRRTLNYNPEVIRGILSGGAESLRFLRDFWNYETSELDIKYFRKFCSFIKVFVKTGLVKRSAAALQIDQHQARTWRDGKEIPVLMKLYSAHNQLVSGRQDIRLLPLRVARNCKSFERWITVPTRLECERDVRRLLSQLRPLPETYERAKRFQESVDPSSSTALFAFLLGVILGDAGKDHSLHEDGHRLSSTNLKLRLSKRYEHNERFGEYAAMCCNSLGLRMYRIKDLPPDEKQLRSPAKAGFYSWRSERSPLLAWIFNKCLGLNFNETTTTTPVRMEWLFKTPRDFRIAFLQGLAESDGHVSYQGVACIASEPNVEFVVRLMQSLGVKSWTQKIRGRECLVVTTVGRGYSIKLFNEHIASIKYQRMEKMITAKRLWRLPDNIKDEIIRLSDKLNPSAITAHLLNTCNIYTRPSTIARYLRRQPI